MSARLSLPPKLVLSTVAGVVESLQALRGKALELDASAVQQISAPGLQVLLSAQKTWVEDGQALSLTGATDAMQEQLLLLGANTKMLTHEDPRL